jgi:thiol-disulfide isomerase/thioredoxin
MNYADKFAAGFEYNAFLQKYGSDAQRQKWQAVHRQVTLKPTQQKLLSSFIREMKVLVLAGTWCGDCVNQCPIFDHFAAACPQLEIRFFDRDDDPELGEQLMICGAVRVPAVLFLSEDNFVCGRYGDRTLAKYREMVASQLGPACPSGIGGVEQTLLNDVTQEWLNEFERIQWMLRLSQRLRSLHGD